MWPWGRRQPVAPEKKTSRAAAAQQEAEQQLEDARRQKPLVDRLERETRAAVANSDLLAAAIRRSLRGQS